MGFSEAILVLLALGGFAAHENPNAPPAAEVLRFAPEDADLMVYTDVEAVLPPNYQTFQSLPTDPSIRALPQDAQREIADAVREAEKGRAELREKSGIDPITDVKSIALYVSFRDKGDPDIAATVRGRFGQAVAEKLAAMEGDKSRKETVAGQTIFVSSDGKAAFALVDASTIVGGTARWVRERARGGWKAYSGRGGVGERARAAIADKPIFLLVARPSATAMRAFETSLKDPDAAMLRDILVGQESSQLEVLWNGVGWTYVARSAAGYGRATMASDGMIQVLRAGHLLMRGLTKLFLAAVDSYAQNKDAAQIIAHKTELLRIVEQWSGDGNFNASVEKKDGERRVGVRLTGKTLSEVVPVAGIAILVGAAVAVFR
jgi:hypothetical protein